MSLAFFEAVLSPCESQSVLKALKIALQRLGSSVRAASTSEGGSQLLTTAMLEASALISTSRTFQLLHVWPRRSFLLFQVSVCL